MSPVGRDLHSERGRRGAVEPAIPAFFLYGEPPRPADDRTMHIETIAARSRLHDWKIDPHRHGDLHQVLLIHRGHIELRLDDLATSHRAPALVIVPAGTVHGFRFVRQTQGWVVSFAGGLARDPGDRSAGAFDVLERARAVPLTRAALAATDLVRLGDMLLREFAGSARGRETTLRGLLAALLGNLVRLAAGGARAGEGADARDRELVARFRRSIERRYREHASIAAHAAALAVSNARLRRACALATGQRPIALVHRRMIVEAERQLRYTTLPVAQIAYELGFNDPAYFTRFFTQRTGTSPRAFRRRAGRG